MDAGAGQLFQAVLTAGAGSATYYYRQAFFLDIVGDNGMGWDLLNG